MFVVDSSELPITISTADTASVNIPCPLPSCYTMAQLVGNIWLGAIAPAT